MIFIFLIHINCEAQSNSLFIDIMGGGGKLLPHPKFKYMAGSVALYNARLGFKTSGNKEWQRVYNYPEIGIGISHNYLTSGSIGNPTAVYSFMNLPLLPDAKLKLNLGINLGLAWGFNQNSGQNQKKYIDRIKMCCLCHIEYQFRFSDQSTL